MSCFNFIKSEVSSGNNSISMKGKENERITSDRIKFVDNVDVDDNKLQKLIDELCLNISLLFYLKEEFNFIKKGNNQYLYCNQDVEELFLNRNPLFNKSKNNNNNVDLNNNAKNSSSYLEIINRILSNLKSLYEQLEINLEIDKILGNDIINQYKDKDIISNNKNNNEVKFPNNNLFSLSAMLQIKDLINNLTEDLNLKCLNGKYL